MPKKQGHNKVLTISAVFQSKFPRAAIVPAQVVLFVFAEKAE